MSFERLQCLSDPRSGASISKCVTKSIDRDHIRVDLQEQLNSTIKMMFVHYKLYYQFSTNEFRQFAVDVVEDFCGYMKGNQGNILISKIYPDIIPYTNFNHTCPYTPGSYFLKMSNLSVNSLAPSLYYCLQDDIA